MVLSRYIVQFNSYTKVIAVVILLGVVSSCSPEKKIATEFVSKASTKNILVLAPDYLFKVNLKTYLMDSLAIADDEKKDSLLLIHSEFLSELNDSLFIANYMLGYSKTLGRYGFKIFNQEQIEEFLSLDSNTYQINIAQVELEETIYTFRDEVSIYDNKYFYDHNLNAVYVNSWFEINNLDKDESVQQIYFSSDMITDIADGTFDYDIFSGKVRYMYNLDSLKTNVLYEFAYRLGREYAGYTFDFLLNDELNSKVQPDARTNKYWRYDPINHYFYPATDDRFILLKE